MKRKKSQMEYLPLRFVNSNKEYAPGEAFQKIIEMLGTCCKIPEDLSEDEYVRFLSSEMFLNPFYNGRLNELNSFLVENADVIMNRLGAVSAYGSARTELKDVYLFPVLSDRWMRYKQVYRIDGDFANALLGTDNLSLSRDMLKRLPYRDFYVDLEKCKNFVPVNGLFMHVASISDKAAECAVYLLTEDLVFFSQYITLVFDEKGVMVDDAKNHSVYTPYLTASGDDLNDSFPCDSQVGRDRVSFFALQLISYLTSKEPDTEPDRAATGAKPYIPGSRIKNKFAEITRHEVGVRVGSRIRVSIKEMSDAKVKVRTTTQYGGTSKIPHVRAAHWSHYWTGKGRTVYETRWIEPCFVNCSVEENGNGVTVHNVK